jgi:hypothetical protein
LYLGYSHKTAGLVDPRSQKTLALVVALILSVGAFLLAAGEARAEQPLTVVEQHTPLTSSVPPAQVSGPYSVGTPAAETSFPQTPPPDSSTPTLQPELSLSPDQKPRAETLSAVSLLNDSATLVDQPDPKPLTGKPTPLIAWGAGTDPESKDPGALGDRQVRALGRHADSKPAPLAFEPAAKPAPKQTAALVEENELLLPLTERELSAPPTAPPKKTFAGSRAWAQQLPQTPPAREQTVVTTAGGTGDPVVVETPPAQMPLVDRAPLVATPPTATAATVEWASSVNKPYAAKPVVPEPAALAAVLIPPPIGPVGAAPSPATWRAPVPAAGPVGSVVQTPQNAAGAAANMLPDFTSGPSSTGSPSSTEDPSKEAPPPSAPSAPLDNGSLALSGGGQAGSSSEGGVAPLFLFVLAAGLLLAGRQDGLLSLVFCAFPKPSSALLMPLERPG